jgi:hypothetical protein
VPFIDGETNEWNALCLGHSELGLGLCSILHIGAFALHRPELDLTIVSQNRVGHKNGV